MLDAVLGTVIDRDEPTCVMAPSVYTPFNGRRPLGNRKSGGVSPNNHYGKRTNG